MSMSRKHYKLIAEAMKTARGGASPWTLAVDLLAEALKTDNPAFNNERFLDACYGENKKEVR